jgi:hypothetical protein
MGKKSPLSQSGNEGDENGRNPDFSGFELEPTSGFEPLTC